MCVSVGRCVGSYCVGRVSARGRFRLIMLSISPLFYRSTRQHDELVVLRLRTKKGEFIMTPDEGFSMVVFQDPNYVEPPPDPKAVKAPAAGDEKKASA